MAIRLRWNNRTKIVLIISVAYGALFLAVAGYFEYQFNKMKTEIDATLEVLDRCHRLRLSMERDEVIQVMGPPQREYDVRENGEALYRELIYKLPGNQSQPPYVDLDLETKRAVEIFCSENSHLILPPNARLDLGSNDQPLPTYKQ